MERDVHVLRSMLMPNFIKRTMISALTIGILLALGGCNTMQGLGKDVEKAGEAIQKSTK